MSKQRGKDEEPGFAELVGEVRRIESDTVDLGRARKRVPRPRAQHDLEGTAEAGWSDPVRPESSPPEYCRAGAQRKVLKRLRRGGFTIDAEIDLHGLGLTDARQHLARFLEHARRDRLCCVRVIHGKGLRSQDFRAVLKPHVRHWLCQDERVLAYTPAPDHAGGDGATHVLLRARRE